MWIQTNPNPRNLLIDDCTVRALSLVLGCTWDEAAVRLDAEAFRLKVMPDSRVAFHSVMKSLGFKRKIIPDTCPVPSMPVYGMTPIFTCPQNQGCGCGGFAA